MMLTQYQYYDEGPPSPLRIIGSVQHRAAELGVCRYRDAVREVFAAGGGADDRGEAGGRGGGAQVHGVLPERGGARAVGFFDRGGCDGDGGGGAEARGADRGGKSEFVSGPGVQIRLGVQRG